MIIQRRKQKKLLKHPKKNKVKNEGAAILI